MKMAGNNQMTASTTNTNTEHDHTWSGKKMGGDNGLNTVKSLRGRLLAERQASRAAKEEADSLGNKFVKLEKKLREEIKLRDKAQRKLQFLKKMLESLNISISSPSGQWEHSYLSENFENSRGSSSCSVSSTHSESNETKPHTTDLTLSENAMHNYNVEDASAFTQKKNHNNSETGLILCKNPNQSSENLKNDESRLSSLSPKSSVIENEDDHEDFLDNSPALVPVTFPATSQATNNHKPLHESVLEALDALKLAREGLLCSMGTRPMIKVVPTH